VRLLRRRPLAGCSSRFALAGLAHLVVFTIGAPLTAAVQEPDRPAGWLGVRVTQNFVCIWETSDAEKECDLELDISEVQEGGPAARGGLLPGDRMIAINGQDLTFMTWEPLRRSIRAGTPVSIDVMRDEARHFARVTPAPVARDAEGGRWIGPARSRTVSRERRSVFVVTLTPLNRAEGEAAFAITVRDTEDQEVEFEPAALRVTGGRLRLVPLSEETYGELPDLRREIVGTLRGITNSSYERASNAVQVVENIRARLPSDSELRARLTRIAQVGLDEVRLATTFNRSWAGALFEPASRNLASAVEAQRGGLIVLRVIASSPAARLGLREGDIVFQAGDTPIEEVKDLQWAIESAQGPLEIRWIRKGSEMRATYRR
jgi:S1-C subfamily serine protease